MEKTATLVLTRTIGPDSSRLDINVKDAEQGVAVRMQLVQDGKQDKVRALGVNMDCRDIGWDVDSLTFYSKRDREKYDAELTVYRAGVQGKEGDRDDSGEQTDDT